MSFPSLYPILPLTLYSSHWPPGNVTLLTLHEWVLTLLPDVAPRIADDAVSERAFYKNALTGATTIVEYRRNEVCRVLCFIYSYRLLIRLWLVISLSLLSSSHPIYLSLFLSLSLQISLTISIPLSLSHTHTQEHKHARKYANADSHILSLFLSINEQIIFESECASTIAIAKENITRLATYRRIQLEEKLTTDPRSVSSFIGLVRGGVSVIYFATLYYIARYYTTLHYNTLQYNTLHYTTLHYPSINVLVVYVYMCMYASILYLWPERWPLRFHEKSNLTVVE